MNRIVALKHFGRGEAWSLIASTLVVGAVGCAAVAAVPNPIYPCMGNLRRIGLGLLMYAEANDGWIPPYRTNETTSFGTNRKARAEPLKWKMSLRSVGGVPETAFWCDEAKKLGPKPAVFGDDYKHTSYSTMTFLGAVGREERAIGELVSTQGSVSLNLANVVNPRDGYLCDITYYEDTTKGTVYKTAHGEGYSCLMFDGSVAHVPIDFVSEPRRDWRKPPRPLGAGTR